MTTNRPYVAIRDYFNEKNAIGILSSLSTTRSIPPDKRYWDYAFVTSPRYYLEILCPGLAQVCCLNHVSPCVSRDVYRDDLDPTVWYKWILVFYPNSTLVTKDRVSEVTEHLRKSKNVLWKPGK